MHTIRPYQPTDYEQLNELIIQLDIFQKQNLEHEQIHVENIRKNSEESFQLCLKNKEFQYFVAVDGNELIGYSLADVSGVYVRKGSIDQLYVLPQHRGRGIGAALLEAGLQWLKTQGVDEVNIAVHKTNKAAHRLYATAGFTEQEEEYQNMRKTLA